MDTSRRDLAVVIAKSAMRLRGEVPRVVPLKMPLAFGGLGLYRNRDVDKPLTRLCPVWARRLLNWWL